MQACESVKVGLVERWCCSWWIGRGVLVRSWGGYTLASIDTVII